MSILKQESIKLSVLTSAACMALTAAGLSLAMPQMNLAVPLLIAAVLPFVVALPVATRILNQRSEIRRLKDELRECYAGLQHLQRLNDKRETIDSMTGLFNRQHFLNSAEKFRRMASNGAMIIVDADGIRSINDRFGNSAGDMAISKISYAVEQAVRKGDILGRIGGEEFAVYLTGVTRQQLLMVAERIRSNVAEIRFNPDGTRLWPLSVSIGVTMDTHMDEMGHMLKRADLALFDAKKGGKNRVSYCRPEASAMVA